jgi:hypothetical protein
MNPVTNLKKVEHYMKSIENGDFADIVKLFSPDAVLEELPNRIYRERDSLWSLQDGLRVSSVPESQLQDPELYGGRCVPTPPSSSGAQWGILRFISDCVSHQPEMFEGLALAPASNSPRELVRRRGPLSRPEQTSGSTGELESPEGAKVKVLRSCWLDS